MNLIIKYQKLLRPLILVVIKILNIPNQIKHHLPLNVMMVPEEKKINQNFNVILFPEQGYSISIDKHDDF